MLSTARHTQDIESLGLMGFGGGFDLHGSSLEAVARLISTLSLNPEP